MIRCCRTITAALCLVPTLAGCASDGERVTSKPEEPQTGDRLQWWREARFGMFVHWGPVSLKGTEIGWSRGGERRGRTGSGEIPVEIYDNLYKQFNPEKFDADEWIRIARDAGMKYFIFTTKHHDGFVNFDSKLTDYKITSPESPFGRDIVAELAAACHRAGMPLGFYYSPPDWHHPDYRTERHDRYIEYLHGQLRELCTKYGKVDIIWFDGLGGTAEDWDSPRLFEMIHALQPGVIINNRAGLPADHDTPEQRIGAFQKERPWETCMTICRQWAWRPDDEMKSLEQCIHTLVRVVGGDGNFLFNVGPMPDGRIEPRQVERLREMGRWLKTNGESVYGTRGGPFKPTPWLASTCKDNVIYVHVLNWEGDTIQLPVIDRKIVRSSLLTGGRVDVDVNPDNITVTVPERHRQDIDTIIVLELDGPAETIAPINIPSRSLAFHAPATASNVFRNMPEYAADKAADDEITTRWATDAGTKQAWLAVDLGRPRTINRAIICEAFDRVRQFELQHQSGGQWHTFHKGSRIGQQREIRFDPIEARHIRLNILEAIEGPTIWEFQLMGKAK